MVFREKGRTSGVQISSDWSPDLPLDPVLTSGWGEYLGEGPDPLVIGPPKGPDPLVIGPLPWA